MLYVTDQSPEESVIPFAGPTNPIDYNVRLDRCPSQHATLPVNAFLQQVDDQDATVGDQCDVTDTFNEFCEGVVICRFTQGEFRDEARSVCNASYDEAQMTFVYNCLPGIVE